MSETSLQKYTDEQDLRIKSKRQDEVVVQYRPHAATQKWLAYRFSAWNSAKAWFAMSLAVLFFACGGPGVLIMWICRLLMGSMHGAGGTAAVITGMDTFLAQMIAYVFATISFTIGCVMMRHPTHVSCDANGIAMEWNRLGLAHEKRLRWSNVERIDLFWPEGKASPQDCLIRFQEISHDGTPKYPIQLKLGAIATIEERSSILQAIEWWGSKVARDSKLIEMLAPPQDHNYTELWLQALSAPPKRERLTPLHPGAELRNGMYTVKGQLGVGGQGTAYLARDPDGHEIVLKEFILPVYVEVNVRRQALERMQNEASMLSRLDHPNIVRLHDFFVEDHRGYLVLGKVDGLSLREMVSREGKMTEKTVRELASQMCRILTYLHSLSPPVVHRDFTPDNLILARDGSLTLVDFNVAQQTESTATGTVVGKHAYISPEQFRGKPNPQSDIYSMGATLYYLVTAEDPEPITCSHPKKELTELSAAFDSIVSRATALDTAKRYANIQELQHDLEEEAETAARLSQSGSGTT